MCKVEFTEEQVEEIHRFRFHHPHPRVQLKMEVLWLKSQGLPYKDIMRLARISENTLRSYLYDFIEGGLEKIQEINFRRPVSQLVKHKVCIKKDFDENPPATIKEAQVRIEKLSGIKRSLPQIRKFLKSIGIRRRKMGMLPAKADPEKQAEFLKKN